MWKKGEAWARAVAEFSLAFIESLDRKCCTASVDIMFQFGSL